MTSRSQGTEGGDKSTNQAKLMQSQTKSQQSKGESSLYFHSILCNPYLLENPRNQEHSYMKDLFQNKIITRVRKSSHFLTVDMKEKKQKKVCSVLDNYKFEDERLQQELSKNHQRLTELQTSCNEDHHFAETQPHQQHQEYLTYLQKVKQKNIIVWFVPVVPNKGTKLRGMSISNSLLQILNYKVDELALDIQNLGDKAVDIIDGEIFKTSFTILIDAMTKPKDAKNDQEIKPQARNGHSEAVLVNRLRGKRNKIVMVETKIYMPSSNMLVHEIVKVLSQKQIRDIERMHQRQEALSKVQQISYDCLKKIAKMPRIRDPDNNEKVAGYREIKVKKPRKETESDYYI